MRTRKLILKELDHNCLPLENTQIVFFDKHSSYGMFEQNYTKCGQVVYLYGDIADTLEQAIEAGGYISLDLEDESEMAIPVGVDGGELETGTLWMYEHEYLPVLDTDYFPFQDQEYYEVALGEGWCSRVETGREDFEVPRDGGSVIMTYIYEDVIFNDKLFHVEWVSSNGGLGYRLLHYKVQEDNQ